MVPLDSCAVCMAQKTVRAQNTLWQAVQNREEFVKFAFKLMPLFPHVFCFVLFPLKQKGPAMLWIRDN